jgi:hypothetical protein
VIYGDERCTFLCRVPENYTEKIFQPSIYHEGMKEYAIKIKTHVDKNRRQWKWRYFNLPYMKYKISKELRKIFKKP